MVCFLLLELVKSKIEALVTGGVQNMTVNLDILRRETQIMILLVISNVLHTFTLQKFLQYSSKVIESHLNLQ